MLTTKSLGRRSSTRAQTEPARAAGASSAGSPQRHSTYCVPSPACGTVGSPATMRAAQSRIAMR